MKALIYDGPEKLDFRDAADPVPASGQQMIKVMSVGICGSDMHAYLGHDARRPAPLILGHEAAGVIVGGTRDGERVTINPLVACGTCPACQVGKDNLCPERMIISMPPREGAFAQYVAMRDQNLVTVPDHVTLDQASLAEPLACGWHTVRLARETLQESAKTALVIGGGAIGLGAALSLKAQGVDDVTVVEPNPLRRDTLINTCGQKAIAPDDLPADAMFDLVIDGVGYAATRKTASAHARPGGVIGHIGLGDGEGGLDIRRMTLQEITFIGTYTYTAQDFRDTAEAIFNGDLGPLNWTQSRPLSDGAAAFADIRAGRTEAPKIILHPHS
ncbi:MAG: alcohol dehydrogenase catalytic domain-containing protein [Sulfitobacter sp.]